MYPMLNFCLRGQAQHQISYMGYEDLQHPPAHTPGAISERGPATPWNHEDYEFPHSVGPVSIPLQFSYLNFFYRYTKASGCLSNGEIVIC